jgi:hypothetical protein
MTMPGQSIPQPPEAAPPPRERSSAVYLAIAFLVAVGSFIALAFTEDDPYTRYKAVGTTDYIKAGWIYERLHFDPTPVDVAFIGSSRTMQGINSLEVEKALNTATGEKYHVVNLGLPKLGRDAPFLVGRMLAETKKPKIVLVEVDYLNIRNGTPIYPQLATFDDLLHAPQPDMDFFYDLVSIPARHGRLLWQTLTSGKSTFDPASYRGEHWDDDYQTMAADGRISPPRITSLDKDELHKQSVEWVRLQQQKVGQYDSWAWAEFYYNETNEQRLLELLRRSGVKIVLLYMTALGSPERPFRFERISGYGDLWPTPPQLTGDPTIWVNPTHMNYYGAQRFSAWLGGKLATALPSQAAAK